MFRNKTLFARGIALQLCLCLLAACGGGEDPAPGGPIAGTTTCSSLAGRAIGGAQINGASQSVVAGTSACVIAGRLDPAIHFEVTIPCDWNGKLLYLGSGGFGGTIASAASVPSPGMLGDTTCDGRAPGYAVVASDMGHQAANLTGEWVLTNPNAVDDFAFRAVHVVQAAAREIVRAYTGSVVTRAYFEGCSDGGREGLIAAQRYPTDFDGIVARAPASNVTGNMLTGNLIARRLAAAGARPSQTKLDLLGAAQLGACDDQDGLADGIIGLPNACAGVIDTLQCPSGTDTPDCLTAEEVATFKQVRAPTPLQYMQADGVTEYAGYPPGHEQEFLSWPLWILNGVPQANPPVPPLKINMQSQFLKYFIAGDANADPLQMVLMDYFPAFERESYRLDATNANLNVFFDRGGKLILWHGLADPALSANETSAYFERVRTARGPQVDTSLRYYTAPGVLHCGQGPGADTVDLVTPLAQWVESGTAPDILVARRYLKNPDGTPQLSTPPVLARPLCRYPQYAQYNGTGDSADAASFSCRDP